MKRYTKTHKTKVAQDNHIEAIKKRGGKINLLHQGGSTWRFEYWFGEKQKPGPKKGVARGPKSKDELLRRIRDFDINSSYSLMDKYKNISGRKYVATKVSFKKRSEAIEWVSENIDLQKDYVVIVNFKEGNGYMPYSSPKPASKIRK